MFVLAALLGLTKLASAAGGNYAVDLLLDYNWAYPLDTCVKDPNPITSKSYKYVCASDGASVTKSTYSGTTCSNTATATSVINTAGYFYCGGTNSYVVASVYSDINCGSTALSAVPLATNVCVASDNGAVQALIDSNSYVSGGFGEAQCSGTSLTISAYSAGDSTCANTAYATSTVDSCTFLFNYAAFNMDLYIKITNCIGGVTTTTTSTSSPYTTLAPFVTTPATDIYARITVTATVQFGSGYGWLVCKANYWLYALNAFLACNDIDVDITWDGTSGTVCSDYNAGGTITVTATVQLTEAQFNAAYNYIANVYTQFPEQYKSKFQIYAGVANSADFNFAATISTTDGYTFTCVSTTCSSRSSSSVSRNIYGLATGLAAGVAIAAL